MNKSSQESGIAYLPERYKRQIEAKKRKRLVKKIAVFSAILAAVAIIYLIMSGGQQSGLGKSPLLLPGSVPSEKTSPITPVDHPSGILNNTLATENPAVITGNDTLVLPTLDLISLENATLSLRKDYPAPAYSLISVNVTDRYPGRTLYEFRIKSGDKIAADTGFLVFIDASNGDPFTPGQESARITPAQAKTIIKESFLTLHPDNIRLLFNNSPGSVRAWIFRLSRDNTEILSGSMDPDTGEIVSFTRNIQIEGRQADPLVDISAAQKIADRYIFDKNSVPLPLNMSAASYISLGSSQKPVAGQYLFLYNRIVQDIPCDNDGVTISVDSSSGDITGYDRRWTSPDSAFSVATDPLVTRYEATYAVLKKAQETYPSSGDSIAIVSEEIRWKDQHQPGSIPRPGSIPIAWKLQFTDATIRAEQVPVPAVGWVDAQTGAILDFYYHH